MYHFSFVILHYLAYEATAACIDSILSTYAPYDNHFSIVVVDNASSNNSFSRLKERFLTSPRIHWISAESNLGFAKGNNLGYLYALGQLHADFIIIANNDTVFTQPNFLEVLADCYTSDCNGFSPALIGPDIRNVNGFHQNPYRDHIITSPEISRWIRNRRLWTAFLYADRYLHLSKHVKFFRDYYLGRTMSGKPCTAWKTPACNVVLQGACIIFTPAFVKEFPEYAFYPETFMYCEEDIIAYLCTIKGLMTYYTPALHITHDEAISTGLSTDGSTIEKELFLSKNILKSLKILKRLQK